MMEIGPLLGGGRVADAYAYGEHVLKLYKDRHARSTVFAEAAILAIVADHPLPAPAVHAAGLYDGRWGLVMSRAPGAPLADVVLADPTSAPEALEAMVAMHLAMHARTEVRLTPMKRRLQGRLAVEPRLDAGARQRRLADLAALPDGDRLCHGDFHPFNIIGSPGAAMIVDWPDATSGPPAADACRSYLLLYPHVPDFAEAYLARYAALSGIGAADILAWLPVLAASRLCENVPEEIEALLPLANA